jgi:CRISPR type III-A-associated protein Csm2
MQSVINQDFNPVLEFDKNKHWITKEIDTNAINYLENLGYYLCHKKEVSQNFTGYEAVTISQIRNIFGEVKRIENNISLNNANIDWRQDFALLRPKIAYNAARVLLKNKSSRIEKLKTVLEKAHGLVLINDDEKKELLKSDPKIDILKIEIQRFGRFSKFLEAIVAYHKVYGAKEI